MFDVAAVRLTVTLSVSVSPTHRLPFATSGGLFDAKWRAGVSHICRNIIQSLRLCLIVCLVQSMEVGLLNYVWACNVPSPFPQALKMASPQSSKLRFLLRTILSILPNIAPNLRSARRRRIDFSKGMAAH